MNYEIVKYDIIDENKENIATFKQLDNVCLFISKFFEANDSKFVNVIATISHKIYGIVHINLRVSNTGDVIKLKEEDFTIDDEDEE